MKFMFMNGPWENSKKPTLCVDCPNGGDPHIIAVLSRVHRRDVLRQLCDLANKALAAEQANQGDKP
jgi:hypothetical protein